MIYNFELVCEYFWVYLLYWDVFYWEVLVWWRWLYLKNGVGIVVFDLNVKMFVGLLRVSVFINGLLILGFYICKWDYWFILFYNEYFCNFFNVVFGFVINIDMWKLWLDMV